MIEPEEREGELGFRKPTKDDGSEVWELIKHTGVLDLNSSYSYLMWCEIFSETSIVVEREGNTVGFISGFIHPDQPDTLFIWQVAVDDSERGNGIATKMLYHLLKREGCGDVNHVEATVSPSNTASQQLFKGLAKKLNTKCVIHDYFTSGDFPSEGHEDELLFKIGPIQKEKILVEG
ncbi:L-2,4-diaminobutyric acid acetyltransferase [Lentibacillus kapialis]|uniref:L-2,4-diaminobutyric acid acetyltransferase n=1 Tax=Lentibacillus kapialis TaxID=340214 RepID=A0A917PYU8_9BACI|nr:diaminobutyrate acetyltransferase [Lentibacillus kapialis]GGK01938.1 L-2,4-diaminobutyric acid acetyltransferase [Lentibacillus kapialis]